MNCEKRIPFIRFYWHSSHTVKNNLSHVLSHLGYHCLGPIITLPPILLLLPVPVRIPQVDKVHPIQRVPLESGFVSTSLLLHFLPHTTLIIGECIFRNILFVNVVTCCFPGATTPDIMEKLPGLLDSFPTVMKVIVHVGINGTARQQSELTKGPFICLFNLLKIYGKTAFISAPIPTLGRGVGRFSRKIKSMCATHNIVFILNIDLFWQRSCVNRRDNLHLNMLGSRMLAANLQHAVLSSTCDGWLSKSPDVSSSAMPTTMTAATITQTSSPLWNDHNTVPYLYIPVRITRRHPYWPHSLPAKASVLKGGVNVANLSPLKTFCGNTKKQIHLPC